jgi:hypothetical protein
MADGQRELAHSWTYDRLDVYGERRDSERLKASNLSEWPIEQEVRIMGLPERWQGIRCGLIRCSLAPVRPDPGNLVRTKKPHKREDARYITVPGML